MSESAQTTQSSLRWQCRRGMLELDILLNDFLDTSFVNLSKDDKKQFDLLLDYPDQTLIDLLLGKMQSSDKNVNHLVKKINSNLSTQS